MILERWGHECFPEALVSAVSMVVGDVGAEEPTEMLCLATTRTLGDH